MVKENDYNNTMLILIHVYDTILELISNNNHCKNDKHFKQKQSASQTYNRGL